MIARSQIAILHVAKAQIGLDDDAWRALLERVAGVTSSTKLGQAGFNVVMLELERLGFRSTSARRSFGHRPGFATPAQVAKIRALWREWSGSKGEAGLNAWLERTCHVSALRMLPFDEAGKAIEGLKEMARRRQAA